jgi:diguanylate cyclase (GGDEF)-like protein
MMYSFFGLAGFVGLLALASPRLFAVAAELGGLWITAPNSPSSYQSPIDIDQFVIRHSRKFGALVVIVVGFLTLLFMGHIDPSWMPAFLLLVSGFSMIFAFSGLVELGGEVSKIETQLADARIDPLTGLANRRSFDEELQRRLSERSRSESRFSIALVDLDDFKTVNDKFGHLAGDMVLVKGIAEVLRGRKRAMDLAARYGGDEFAIIYPTCELDQASTAAEQLRAAIAAEPLPLEDALFTVTVSIGVAEAMQGDDAAAIIQRADDALYAAKKAGRNHVARNNGEFCELVSQGHVCV